MRGDRTSRPQARPDSYAPSTGSLALPRPGGRGTCGRSIAARWDRTSPSSALTQLSQAYIGTCAPSCVPWGLFRMTGKSVPSQYSRHRPMTRRR